ncbi:MAG: hypothetical protein CO189_04410 [candidate division Zixibacteria bacterium CG_4_9_14_3_um_filter_46_8]|nr:MAG: hypothetical protein CO189_04410 [candidate division Zixibacteria bacterium CG_4_9_14_3_um_filter_46_8]
MREDPQEKLANPEYIEIIVSPGGPLMVLGTLKVILKGGEVLKEGSNLSFCRCGHSQKKPFCDGTHKTIEFDELK